MRCPTWAEQIQVCTRAELGQDWIFQAAAASLMAKKGICDRQRCNMSGDKKTKILPLFEKANSEIKIWVKLHDVQFLGILIVINPSLSIRNYVGCFHGNLS
ncbi:hypothetical protein WISP_08225 [Willisornis vidua]|uniref:Uncharacterized protein n=1 Tax=Willisornis vidua TaxID=1566151 RepID=A0ABQ9DY26_9PASS|nr:hypothetical protein WISP_08225 [Willisornis vidua]